ncbi:MAG: hypothetical protein ACOCQO_01740 [Halanaerobiaceae bacterium]
MDDQVKQKVKTMRYGGVKYINNVPREEIAHFIDELPEDKRDSMAEVTQILKDEGLISLIPDDEPSPPC